jgi:hypothetical protein
MPRTPIAVAVDDISAGARFLVREIASLGRSPSHVEMLNFLARAAGFRNYQHLKARGGERPSGAKAPAADPRCDRIENALRCFDARGTLVRWPTRAGSQALCLWALWARLPKWESLDERAISERLRQLHTFGDPAMLRRELVGAGLFTRTLDCRDYRRVELPPPPEAAALIQALAVRSEPFS